MQFNTMLKTIPALLIGATLSSAALAADIKLGVAEALTGPAAKYGVAIKNGFTLASEEINAKGGVNGDKLALVIEDEQGKKEEAINVFKKLIFQDKVLAVFGPTLSNSAFAADPIANAAKVVVFGTSNTADGITAMGPFTFRNSVMEADVLPVTVKAAVKHFGIKKVAVIYGNDDAFTKSGYDVFKATLEQQKIPVTTTEAYAKGDVDFKAQLTKIKAGNPDAIVCSCLAEEAANIILQTRALGMKQPFIGGNGLNSPKLFEIAKDAGDNTLMGSPWSAENQTPANKAFIAAYKAKFGSDPDQFAAQAYDAMYIMADAIKSVKLSGNLAKDRDALRAALPAVKIDGATGKFAFRAAPAVAGKQVGFDADQEAIVNIAKGGKFVLLK
ncbi:MULTISPECIES: ABC transporter substrate-binding protein [Herbaspirillum]|jgi:amino acid/amide ABC transporter substrate-binding protein, HAAT family (TC 3.A.1.4.-)|uniref:ABC transporter substrate-binding protein n=4 Tax=Herbaspirillum TaxID=963 RepID=A0AAJ2LVA4_9BURK|nr:MULTISPECIES: ABC transporter substrate-binding protein [Herbaspirillum]MBW9332383.1 ABC transporter substrate-binding protein [Herbaspirillum sp. RU 5E]MBP1313980.1 branched-chain amino acid transport system substrate-binding protein [Herbaspirillum sp. 1130]MDR9836388.1 ABC transporter substrate-binding protein [Herbaspirillum huttiense]MDR9848262.1 ABC transporter substrate-binding protein [Herbaspirillum huttiense SE1]MRT29312.1 ABC transporter substrate-binding protein [Herbaspirillum 